LILENAQTTPPSVSNISELNKKKSAEDRQRQPKDIVITQATKEKLKKDVNEIYQKMLLNFKICAGETAEKSNVNVLSIINRRFEELFMYLREIKQGETRLAILKQLNEETKELNKKSKQIDDTVEEMIEFCGRQGEEGKR